jgi:hypothetical protein
MHIIMNGKQKIRMVFVSTGSLLAAFALLQLTEWAFVNLCASLSGFRGDVVWHAFAFYARNNHGNQQFVSLYLYPEMLFFLLFLALSLGKNTLTGKFRGFSIVYAWLFLIFLLKALFFPFWQILYKTGIYYAFSWLGFSWPMQYAIGFFLLGIFIYYGFKVSSLFSFGIHLGKRPFLKPKDILSQLIFIWLIPFLIFSLVLVFVAEGNFTLSVIYWLAGVAGTLLINVPVISWYQVIVK